MQKIIIITTKTAVRRMMMATPSAHSIIHTTLDGDGENVIAVVEPTHHGVRALLAVQPDVTVLPGIHDPNPIGDAHQHLAIVAAQPHETMREVALRLHDALGPQFHPDS